jgi:MFS family permease
MTKESRGMGASIVSGVGIAGSVLAFIVAEKFNWRVAYWTGGVLGLLLLVLRVAVYESGMYEKIKTVSVSKGNFFSLFTNIRRFKKFIFIILLAIPTWYTISVLAINSSSIAQDALKLSGTVKGSTSVMLHYIGATLGSFLFGYLSLKMKSRKKPLVIILICIAVLTTIYFSLFGASPTLFYMVIFLLGLPMGGLWTVFIISVSEQFGTNIRATVTTSAPNFVRGFTILITFLLGTLAPLVGLWYAGVIVGSLFFIISMIALYYIEETYGKDLDYYEDIK